MPSLLQRLTTTPETRASAVALSIDNRGVPVRRIEQAYPAYADRGYLGNVVVFACIAERRRVFSDIEFRWQRQTDKKLFGTEALGILERPWPGGTTQDLLDRMMVHNDLGGNSYVHRATLPRTGDTVLQPLRPDWVTLVLDPLRAEVVAYLYWEGGQHSGVDPQVIPADEVAHFFTHPDPLHPWKGVSWLTPALHEIEADQQGVRYQQKFYTNAATPSLLVKTEKIIQNDETRKQLLAQFERLYSGVDNAFKTLILDDGADATPLGFNFEQSQFVQSQAQTENRIINASGVPPVLIGGVLGLGASTYSNYAQSSKSFATKMRPMWRSASGSLEQIVTLPPARRGDEDQNVRLWYDDSNNAAMRADARDEAEILGLKTRAIRQLLDAGFDAATAVNAVNGNDLDLLEHTGLFSVQLQPPGPNQGEQE